MFTHLFIGTYSYYMKSQRLNCGCKRSVKISSNILSSVTTSVFNIYFNILEVVGS